MKSKIIFLFAICALIYSCNNDSTSTIEEPNDVYQYQGDIFTDSWSGSPNGNGSGSTTIHETNSLLKIKINENYIILYPESIHLDSAHLSVKTALSDDYLLYEATDGTQAYFYNDYDSLVLKNTLYAMSGASAIKYFRGSKH